ncbi:TPA: CSS-motif domain-containing protein [Aeromonas hydrophila]|uniref:CSS-motif domain-containing protein n=1 Tax=Aeromonas hydrophila TaxID=644 RepID=UPI0038D0AF5A
MLFFHKFILSAARFRNLATLLLLSLLLSFGGVVITLAGHKQHKEHSVQTVRQVIRNIDQLLTSATQINHQVGNLLGQPCQTILPTLREITSSADIVSTLNLIQDKAIYCSSLQGVVNEPVRRDDFFVGRLSLVAGNTSQSTPPHLMLLTSVTGGQVISSLDSTNLMTMLSSNVPTTQVWLQIGQDWLDGSGQFGQSPPTLLNATRVTRRSVTYPFAITADYVYDKQTWLSWFQQWKSIWLLWLTVSFFHACTLWYWLGRHTHDASLLHRLEQNGLPLRR